MNCRKNKIELVSYNINEQMIKLKYNTDTKVQHKWLRLELGIKYNIDLYTKNETRLNALPIFEE